IYQQCPELLKNILKVVLNFVYSLLLKQYNLATSYNVKKQDINLFEVYYNKDYKHAIC
ncbi:10716_t:CDS:1, partial [Cetraspora pellucida]